MQDTAIGLAENAGLQKELLPKAHVAVGEDEWETVALNFVVKLYTIRSSDKRHETLSYCRCLPIVSL
jgi:hypothetical protein